MSYEGYREYITKDGRYYCRDAYDDEEPEEKPYWWNSVDVTNGQVEGDPSTYPAKKEETEPVERECVDHRGNVYYVLEKRWKPVGERWRKVE